MLWNFDWFPSFLITVRQGRRWGYLISLLWISKPIILCILLSQRKPCCYWYFTILYLCFSLSLLLLFQGHVTFLNSTLTGPLHYMALHCITSTTNLPPPISGSHLACIAGGILVPGVPSRRPRKAKWSEKPQGKVHWLYTHSSCGSAAKTIHHPQANPASYAGYM